MTQPNAKLHCVELGHAFVQVEQNSRSKQPWNDRREHERVGHRIDLDGIEAMPRVERRGEHRRDGEEGAVLEDVVGLAAATSGDGNPMGGDGALAFEARFAWTAQADDVHLVTRELERLDFAPDSRVERVVALPDEAEPCRAPISAQ